NNEYKKEYLTLKKGKKCNKEDLEKELTKGSMLVSDEVDEVSQLKVLNNAPRFNTPGISFPIAPTMKCNYACP
ncbi:radical SAM protein, partial [Enterococcus faecalis]|nr:radical SAM protein [Enterococcus faecalis]